MEMLNPVWDEMIQDYEKKRLEEIKTEFAATTQGIESAGLLQSFVDELSSANRLSPPPEELLTRLRGILSGYQKDKIIGNRSRRFFLSHERLAVFFLQRV